MKQVKDFPNYFINKKGELFSKAGNRPLHKIKPALRSSGYFTVVLYRNREIKCQTIHRLVAEAFIPNPENKRTINHKDGNKTNNHVSNLEWNTDAENIQHSYDKLGRKGYWEGKAGNEHHSSKKIKQLTSDGQLIKVYNSASEAERELGVITSNICKCANHKVGYKSAGGYRWEWFK